MNNGSLAQVFAQEGSLHDAEAHHSCRLSIPATVWCLQQGRAHVFLVPIEAGKPTGSRVHLFQAAAGQLLFSLGSARPAGGVEFLAVGGNEMRLWQLPLARLKQLASDPVLAVEIAEGIDRWIQALYQSLARGALSPECRKLAANESVGLAAGEAAQPSSGVLWVEHREGESSLAGIEDLSMNPQQGRIPLTSAVWLQAVSPAMLLTTDTVTQLRGEAIWSSLPSCEALITRWARDILKRRALEEAARLEAKASFQRTTLLSAVTQLSEPLATDSVRTPASLAYDEPLLRACQLVCQAQGITLAETLGTPKAKTSRDPLARLAKAARLRLRRVMLRGEWWLQDNGPMLAYVRGTRQPVALLPSSPTSYVLVDPGKPGRQDVDGDVAHSLELRAHTFQRTFPHTVLSAWQVVKFGLQNTRADLVMILLMGLAAGLLATAVPLAMSLVFDVVIPNSARAQLLFISLGLLAAALASVVFEVTRGIAMVRVEAKSDTAIQAAIWDRLLSLPLPFFREYTAGDLALRANGINAIRQIISGAVITALLSGFFSLFNFGLLFYFSVRLAWVATALVLVNLSITLAVGLRNLRLQRPLYEVQGKISGLVLQLITGIAKLRVAGAELQAYAVWAKAFATQKKTDLKLTALGNRFTVFSEAYPLLTSMCLFAAVAYGNEPGFSTGQFLAFTAAFMIFLNAGLEAGDALISILHAIPIYERARPILHGVPEVSALKTAPGDLRGRIELNQVSFRYKTDGPLVLRAISLHIKPGEFVAIVGPSGSGKSTLLRLLLGFEQPDNGTIRYDGQDLTGLDIQAVRRQIGVVLQHGKLMPGDIFENIVGSALFSIEEAWAAARGAGLDRDIQEMPMGMHTVLGEGGATLSGGQRQRLMIARAIVGKPRIIFFDEATSALDNRTQGTVNQSLAQLSATRVVIAHRLSTIMKADRIVVLQKGELVQTGSYQALLEEPGPFAHLAQRQLA